MHGANRLASNSLLESLVFSRRAAQKIETELEHTDMPDMNRTIGDYEDDETLNKKFRTLIWEEIKRKDEKFYDQWSNNDD